MPLLGNTFQSEKLGMHDTTWQNMHKKVKIDCNEEKLNQNIDYLNVDDNGHDHDYTYYNNNKNHIPPISDKKITK